MPFLLIVEALLFAAIALFIASQIILPLVLGRRLFPFFSREQHLEILKEEVVDDVRARKIQEEIEALTKPQAPPDNVTPITELRRAPPTEDPQ